MNLLVTDYDNTLELHYDFTDNISILNRNVIALNKFMKKNIVCIATGRHFDAINKTLIENNISFNYLCANNGAELYDTDYNLLFSFPIDECDLQILREIKENIFFRNPYNSILISSANIYVNDLNKYNELKVYLNTNLKNSFIEYKFPKIKIINKKCNKLNAVNFIKMREKIENKNIYTIGDDINDADMILKYNGYSLTTAQNQIKKISSKLYVELNQLIEDIDSE